MSKHACDLRDSLPLRVALWLCLGALILGNLIALKGGAAEATGRWLILIALGGGLLATLVYCGHLLLLRFQLSLSVWIGIVALLAFGLLGVSQSLPWLAGRNVSATGHPVKMLLLAASLLAVLMQASAVVSWNVHWLPSWAWQATKVQRVTGMILSDELRHPRAWTWGLYWTAPLVLWTGLQMTIYTSALPDTARRFAWLIYLILLLLAVRVVLGLWTWLSALLQWQAAKKSKDAVAVSESRAVVFGRGLLPAGVLAFYALMVSGTQVQEEVLAVLIKAEQETLAKEQAELNAPPANNAENAESDFDSISAIFTPEPFGADDRTPDARLYLRANAQALSIARKAAAKPRLVYSKRNGSFPYWETGRAINLVELAATHAAIDGNWDHFQSYAKLCLLSLAPESSTLPTYFPEPDITFVLPTIKGLLWEQSPPDEVLENIQAQFRKMISHAQRKQARFVQQAAISHLMTGDEILRVRASGVLPTGLTIRDLSAYHPLVSYAKRIRIIGYNRQLVNALNSNYSKDLSEHLHKEARQCWGGIYRIEGPNLLKNQAAITTALTMVDAGIAAQRYQRKHKRWPATLRECVPEFLPDVPKDPFKSDDVLRFAGHQPQVFSAGENRIYEFEKHASTDGRVMSLYYSWADGPAPGDDLVLFLTPPEVSPHAPLFASQWDMEESELRIFTYIQDLKSADELILITALKQLEQLGYKAAPAVQHLIPLLQDKKLRVRMWAAYVLGRIGPNAPEIEKAIEALKFAQTADADPDFQHFVRDALKKLQRKGP